MFPAEIRSIKLNDIESCMFLSNSEGWNQTENDWKLLIENPQNICLLAETGKRVVATGTAINYANNVAWIGMILVDKEFRRQGISKMILTDLIDSLESCNSVKLDATPAGQPVYEKFKFHEEYMICRMTNLSLQNFQVFESKLKPEPIQTLDIPEIIALDQSVFGAERDSLINYLYSNSPKIAWCIKRDGRIVAFSLGRTGRKYQQIGPVYSTSLEEAKSLISCSLQNYSTKALVVDILADQHELTSWLIAAGFAIQRKFVRMYMNINPFPGKPENQFLICGPEFG